MILISNDFCHKIKNYNFDSYNVLLAIATNIPVLLMTAFMVQGHKCLDMRSDIIISLSLLTSLKCSQSCNVT